MKVLSPRWQVAFDKAEQLAAVEDAKDLYTWKRRAASTKTWAKIVLGLVGVAGAVVLVKGR